MKRLTYEEFEERVVVIARASKIFKPITKNISEAFFLYQEVLAEQKRELFMSGVSPDKTDADFLNNYRRPVCPRCGKGLLLRGGLDRLSGKNNPNRWKTCWVCPDSMVFKAKCYYEEYSHKSIDDWIKELERVEEQDG